MKKGNAWVWGTARIVLAVVLLFLIFRYSIQFSDTVTLSDDTVVSGTILKRPDTDVTITIDGRKRTYQIWEIARKDGEYVIRPDSVELADRNHTIVAGTVAKIPDTSVQILAGGQTLTYPGKDLAYNKKGAPKVEQGLLAIMKSMTARGFVIGLLLLGIVPLVAAVRWRMLLEAQDIHIGFWRSLELTVIGLFFNNFMPGLTGGDVVKAYYAAKLTKDRKTHAVVTVFLDRIIGMVALGLVAGVAICIGIFTAKTADSGLFRQLDYFVAGFIVVSIAGGLVFYSRRLRAAGKTVLHATPGYGKVRSTGIAHKAVAILLKIDSALYLYKYKKMVLVNTTLISFIAHGSAILSIYYFGQALGINQAGMIKYFIVVPVSFIVSSVPLTPAGWGVGEYVFKIFFGAVGIPGTAAITMSVIYRFTQALWTLPGGVALIFQRDRATVEEVEALSDDVLESENVGQGD